MATDILAILTLVLEHCAYDANLLVDIKRCVLQETTTWPKAVDLSESTITIRIDYLEWPRKLLTTSLEVAMTKNNPLTLPPSYY